MSNLVLRKDKAAKKEVVKVFKGRANKKKTTLAEADTKDDDAAEGGVIDSEWRTKSSAYTAEICMLLYALVGESLLVKSVINS